MSATQVSPRVDAHVHVIDPARFPYVPGAGYHPGPDEIGPYEALVTVLDQHRVHGALLVQPSCYGTDNSALLDALQRGAGRFRGIAVVTPDAAPTDLRDLRAAGVVGVRFNLEDADAGLLDHPSTPRLLAELADLGWLVEVYARGAAWTRIAPVLGNSGVRVVVDHFGGPRVSDGVAQEGFAAVCELGRRHDAAVKVSAPFRMSATPPPHEDLRPFVAELVESFGPERLLWGSDWPFINTAAAVAYPTPEELLAAWGLNDAGAALVLRDNPATLLGFAR